MRERFLFVLIMLLWTSFHLMGQQVKGKEMQRQTPVVRKDSVHELKAVIITASRTHENTDRTVIIPSSQQIKASTDGISLLKNLQLPGMFVDPVNQKVEITGTSGVIYKINGINASLQEVSALRAEEIARVEYSQHPSARELDTNSGVIDFILKKKNRGTYVYENVLGALTTGFLNGNVNVKQVFSKSEFSVDYNVNWRDYRDRLYNEREGFYRAPDSVTLDKRGTYAPFGYLYQNINLEYLYKGERDIFSAKFLNTVFRSHDNNYNNVYWNTTAEPLFFRNVRSLFSNYTPSLDLYYIRKTGEGNGIEFNLVGTFMQPSYDRTLRDTYNDNDDKEADEVKNETDGHKQSVVFEAYYYNRKHKVNYDIGFRGSYNHLRNEYLGRESDHIEQSDVYPYASIEGKIKYLYYSLGTGVKYLRFSDGITSKNYFRNLTTFNLFYNPEKNWNVRNVLNFTPSYPSLSDLNSVDQREDTFTVLRGNPRLKPSKILENSLTFSYTIKKDLRAIVYLDYSRTFDPIGENFFYEDNTGYYITQNQNQYYNQHLGGYVELIAYSLLNRINFSAAAVWFRYMTKGRGYACVMNNFNWVADCDIQLKDFTLNLGYKKPGMELEGRLKTLDENYSTVGLVYKKKNLTVGAGVMYPFSSKGTKYMTERTSSVNPSVRYTNIKDNANMFYLNLTYAISWGKQLLDVRKNLNNSDSETGVMKVD